MSEAAANARYIPEPHTEEGTPLEDVYRLDDLVSEKELQACKIFGWDGLVKEGKVPESQYVSPNHIFHSQSKIVMSIFRRREQRMNHTWRSINTNSWQFAK